MSPDSGFLYESAQHSAALTMLEFAMEAQAPFCLLTGEIGSGKTTVIRRLLRMVSDKQISVGLVSHSHGRFKSIHPWALSALGIVDDDESEIGQFEALNDFFIREYGGGRRTLLIFDEAQNLSIRTLEELRLPVERKFGKRRGAADHPGRSAGASPQTAAALSSNNSRSGFPSIFISMLWRCPRRKRMCGTDSKWPAATVLSSTTNRSN